VNLFEARKLARECMYDDQAEAVETLVRAILKDPDDPGLPTVEPPAEGQDPQTGVHAQGSTEQGEDPLLRPNFGVAPSSVEEQPAHGVTPSLPEVLAEVHGKFIEDEFEKTWETYVAAKQGWVSKAEFKAGWDAAHSCYGTVEATSYERGWRAGRGAAVRAVEDLVSQSVRQSPEEAAYVLALNRVNALEVKGDA
jgi:hypothetical protein